MQSYLVLLLTLFFLSSCADSTNNDPQASVAGASTAEDQAGTPVDSIRCGKMSLKACEAFEEVNKQRVLQGVNSLGISDNCGAAAQYHAEDMDRNNYFSHNGLNETWSERMLRFTITGVRAENIAQSNSTPASVVDLWMNSSGHRANILNASYKYAGMGFSNGYWVQCFSGNP